ncbi:hypothetical protein MLD38_033044 [Melastoma candidum]|uniref:Uncharacterized protein n=1 Tax=Melastoma candidum TaxID=119954 RepID=A0ACB9M628_9MYRT|nr:hypothetical protein MLD38_033044 [Melastoma candidum]
MIEQALLYSSRIGASRIRIIMGEKMKMRLAGRRRCWRLAVYLNKNEVSFSLYLLDSLCCNPSTTSERFIPNRIKSAEKDKKSPETDKRNEIPHKEKHRTILSVFGQGLPQRAWQASGLTEQSVPVANRNPGDSLLLFWSRFLPPNHQTVSNPRCVEIL